MNIYAASLLDYNNGRLHGIHIDLYEYSSLEEVMVVIENMLSKSPTALETGTVAEEWEIHDSDIPFDVDCTDLKLFYEHCINIPKDPLLGYLEFSSQFPETFDDFYESFLGEYHNERAFAEELFDIQYSEIIDDIAGYVDYGAYLRDLKMDHFFYHTYSGVLVYRD